MDGLSQRRVQREFWAVMLGAEVEKDGQVKGFHEWWDSADDDLRSEAARIETDCYRRARSGVALVEAVAEARLRLKDYQRYRVRRSKTREDYVRFRLALRTRIWDEDLRPFEVAALLDQARPQHPEIEVAEIECYQQMRDQWQEWQGYLFDYAGNYEAWKNRGVVAGVFAGEPPISSGA